MKEKNLDNETPTAQCQSESRGLHQPRPIIMSGNNPKLIVEGRKTQTRRIMRVQPHESGGIPGTCISVEDDDRIFNLCPYGIAGDRLWVRETHEITDWECSNLRTTVAGYYACDEKPFRVKLTERESELFHRRKIRAKRFASIFMFRSLSRITLEITKVRVERLQDISEQDARAEGMEAGFGSCIELYHQLWDSLHGKGEWDKNPWVWVLEFPNLNHGQSRGSF